MSKLRGRPFDCVESSIFMERHFRKYKGYSWIQVDENCVDIQGLPIAKSMISVCMCVDVPVIFSKLPFWP